MKIKIEEHEEKIFAKVIDCSQKFFSESIPRVAGGWVRDKIMGCQSFDLDIALNGVSGYEFAKKLSELNAEDVSSAGLVKCNPEKSKHLETAVLNIDGHFIDFVNLRKEIYNSTRIPKIDFGTPFEDAHRRDLTINSLFYNIETKEIEDFTGMGIKDLESRILRTPLNPETTFKDDPLRILRIFRFHSKFGFTICKDIYDALKSEELKIQLLNKVSRERISIELFKMVNYPMGHLGILEIIKNGFVDCVFSPKESQEFDYDESLTFFLVMIELLESFKEQSDSSESILLPHSSSNATDMSISLNGSYSFLNSTNSISRGDKTFVSINLQPNNLLTLQIDHKNRWIFNIYIVLYKFSTILLAKKTKKVFLNVDIVKNSLVCSNSTAAIINSIEKGLKMLQKVNLSNLNSYNLYLVAYYLKEYWFEVLILETAMRKARGENYKEVYDFLLALRKERIPQNINFKSTLDVSNLQQDLSIEAKYISYFSAESIIYQQSQNIKSKEDLLEYLRAHKQEIISRHLDLNK